MEQPLTIGAQEEGLARAQADSIVRLLQKKRPSYPVHLELVQPSPEARIEFHHDHIAEDGRSMNVLHQLLREGDLDVVIHRGFDLRDRLAEDLEIVAIPPRSSPYDAMLSADGLTLDELESGARVGVVQLRARVQLLQHRDDLDLHVVPGDVAAWLTAMLDGSIEALILPNAAVEQLGLQERVCEIFPSDLLIPAPASGILACVARRNDASTARRLSPLHDPATAAEYSAEMAFMRALGGRWDEPVAALAQCMGRRMLLLGMLASSDGTGLRREGVEGNAHDPEAVGAAVAELLSQEPPFNSVFDEEFEANSSGLALPAATVLSGSAGSFDGLLDAIGEIGELWNDEEELCDEIDDDELDLHDDES